MIPGCFRLLRSPLARRRGEIFVRAQRRRENSLRRPELAAADENASIETRLICSTSAAFRSRHDHRRRQQPDHRRPGHPCADRRFRIAEKEMSRCCRKRRPPSPTCRCATAAPSAAASPTPTRPAIGRRPLWRSMRRLKFVGPNGERWVKCDDFFLGLADERA